MSGATTNNGSISIATDTEELAGAVGGVGSFSLSTANLRFNSRVSAGQTIDEIGVDRLTLKQAQNFHATINGFGTGDTIDAANFLLSGTTSISPRTRRGPAARSPCTTRSLTAHILDDRPLYELGFRPRPRQRDRHAGEVRGVTKATVRERAFGGAEA